MSIGLCEKFSKKFKIKAPININELYKLIAHVDCFSTVKPLPIWNDEKVRQEVIKNLREIQSLVDINYNITKYYNETISRDYVIGKMKELFESTIHENIKVDLNFNTEDEIYINRLLENNNELNNIERTC